MGTLVKMPKGKQGKQTVTGIKPIVVKLFKTAGYRDREQKHLGCTQSNTGAVCVVNHVYGIALHNINMSGE